MRTDRESKYSEKSRPCATLSTINPPGRASNSDLCSGKPAINSLSYGTAEFIVKRYLIVAGGKQWSLMFSLSVNHSVYQYEFSNILPCT
jgi:hypothetical protein